MRRTLIAGCVAAIGFVIARRSLPKLRERVMARCEVMFERMPDTFPPKRAMSSIEETRAATVRILHLLESHTNEVHEEREAGDRDDVEFLERLVVARAADMVSASG